VADVDERIAAEVAWIYRTHPRPEAAARERLMEKIREARPPGRRGLGPTWWLRPRAISLPPLAWAASALVLVALGGSLMWLAPLGPGAQNASTAVTTAPAGESRRLVRFAVQAPGARRVALVGDFNGWDPQASPMRRVGGTWLLSLPVSGGRHVYAFVVDGERWLSDPAAPLAPEDEFGFRKSVLVVRDPESL